MRVLNVFKSKLFLSCFLFSITVVFFALVGRDVWFSLDDLGNIVNGLICSVKDFLRVFSQDERAYIYPINFTIPKANVISGFYRPLQHIPFTLIYKTFGFYAFAYYLTSVFFHALNTVLIFYLFSFYMPILLALLSGLVFAFAPTLDWITWISCLHNFMAVFFILLSLLFFRLFWNNKKWYWQALAAFMFLLSIISRENTIMLGIWLFCGAFLLMDKIFQSPSFWQRVKFAFKQTWLFGVVYFIYFFLRLNAFGVTSLERTLNNLLLKYPVLGKFLFGTIKSSTAVSDAVVGCANAELSSGVGVQVGSNVAQTVSNLSSAQFSWTHAVFSNLAGIKNILVTWGSSLLNTDLSHESTLFFVCCLIFFMIFAYRKHFRILLTLILGLLFFIWPGIVAYPNPRYISAGYPFLVFIFFLAVHFVLQNIEHRWIKVFIYLIVTTTCLYYIVNGINKNFSGIRHACKETQKYRQRFADFFDKHKFNSDANFIVIGSPFASDIQNVFQAFLDNLDIKLAFVREACIAQCGTMGCSGDYKIQGTSSVIERVFLNGKRGFRLISQDKDHCCWWMNYSHFPLKWSEQDCAYVWTDKPLQVGQWYDFSMGNFIINDRVGQHFVTDVTFLIDDKWIDDKTVFVVWDSMLGNYSVLS